MAPADAGALCGSLAAELERYAAHELVDCIGGDAVKDREPTCAKCGSAMEAGFVLDQTHDAVMRQSAWIEGAPEPSFWTGLKLKGHQRLPVTTYRCSACGYLESYAPPA